MVDIKKICNSIINCKEERSLLFNKNGYSIKECKKCDHRFLEQHDDIENHLNKVYSDEYFFEGKSAGYPNYLDEKEILFKYGIKYAKIISIYAKPGKVLDTGCAAGFILKGFEKSGWTTYGLEPNETMANYGREKLNLSISTSSLETFQTSQTFDLITIIEVIGHFYDVDKAMQNVCRLLNPNGLVLVESWDMKSRIARIFGNKWSEYSPPSVVNWFSDETLTQLFNYYGFEIIGKGFPPKRIKFKHFLSLIDEKTPDFKFKKKVINSLIKLVGGITLIYPHHDLKWYLFRKTS
ncbi:class I SAM-dependent methyltransferase [Ginsengibacter hankyongi]|uniref:Class I SAM-dependent methyltransferase n=1 Tax=Ginsengibacter hankyongi TaxID=2607284 RepID=A0A5J5ID10_9BACT|nr:class I SAM-dependent methyltransferase [Ginsengibacter hankyongi]KAA9035946.1 class I SAM-dependent methyltransferase [Ginsengibacter hankyongi]